MITKTKQILTETSTLTRAIEKKLPELKKYLDETRSTLLEGHNIEPNLELNEL